MPTRWSSTAGALVSFLFLATLVVLPAGTAIAAGTRVTTGPQPFMCTTTPDCDKSGWEVVYGRASSKAGALALVSKIEGKGSQAGQIFFMFQFAVETDGTGWEVSSSTHTSKADAASFLKALQAQYGSTIAKLGLHPVVEHG